MRNAQELSVPRFETYPGRRLPLLCMCLSLNPHILVSEHFAFLKQKSVLVPAVHSILVKLAEWGHVFHRSCQGLSDCEDDPAVRPPINQITQSIRRFGQRECL